MPWDADQLATVDAALASSLEGRPSALVVTGAAGMGKSALLDEVASRAGLSVLRAECLPFSAPAAFAAVEQLGVAVDRSSGTGALAVPLAAQRMREMLDHRLAGGPLVVMVDDLQWAESGVGGGVAGRPGPSRGRTSALRLRLPYTRRGSAPILSTVAGAIPRHLPDRARRLGRVGGRRAPARHSTGHGGRRHRVTLAPHRWQPAVPAVPGPRVRRGAAGEHEGAAGSSRVRVNGHQPAQPPVGRRRVACARVGRAR